MYVHFTFKEGNPFITTANNTLFIMICNNCLEQVGANFYNVTNKRFGVKSYTDKKNQLRDFAREWQANFPDFNYSEWELIGWQEFFEEYGRKYGLLAEFRENGIC